MRVLMVEPHGRSGIHNYTLALVAALSSKCVDVAIIGALDSDWSDLPSDVMVEHRLESFSHTPALPRTLRRPRSFALHVRNSVRLRKSALSSPADVVHLQWPPRLLARRVLHDVSRVRPLVITVHNVLPHDEHEARNARVQRWWGDVYGMADVLICHSEHSVSEVGRVFGRRLLRRTVVVPHGVGSPAWGDLGALSQEDARSRIGLPQSGKIVLSLGVVLPYKGLSILLRALPHSEVASPPQLLIAGWCPDWADYDGIIRKSSLQERVILRLGWIPDEKIPLYIKASDTLALPYSRIDASGVAAAGAFFAAPLLLSDIPGFRSVWGGHEAVFSPSGDERAWAKAMDRVVTDTAALLRMGKAAQSKARLTMSWDVCAEAHLIAYERAIASWRLRVG
jgi:glycosyltransferase involved in cell wall biosynthesis